MIENIIKKMEEQIDSDEYEKILNDILEKQDVEEEIKNSVKEFLS